MKKRLMICIDVDLNDIALTALKTDVLELLHGSIVNQDKWNRYIDKVDAIVTIPPKD